MHVPKMELCPDKVPAASKNGASGGRGSVWNERDFTGVLYRKLF